MPGFLRVDERLKKLVRDNEHGSEAGEKHADYHPWHCEAWCSPVNPCGDELEERTACVQGHEHVASGGFCGAKLYFRTKV